jgi:hypothetical protein
MTSVPQPYPGDVLPARRNATPASTIRRSRLLREYKGVLGDPLSGTVHLRDSADRPYPVEVTDGVLDVELVPGVYRLVSVMHDAGGQHYYNSETVVV